MKITIGVTTHDEDEQTLRKTLKSIRRAARRAWCLYEVVVHLDDGAEETRGFLRKFVRHRRVRLVENCFRDPGKSRNCITQMAKGEYIVFVDGDDLISPNYIRRMYQALRKNRDAEIVVHPEASLTFGEGNEWVLWRMHASLERDLEAFIPFGKNRWVASLAGPREIFLKHPYIASERGFGHEDYALNIALSANGVKHLIAKDVMYFYRKKANSQLKMNTERCVTEPYNDLFDFRVWKDYVISRDSFHTRVNFDESEKVSRSLFREWQKGARWEPGLTPAKEKVERVPVYDTDGYSYTGEAYLKLCRQINEKPGCVVMADVISEEVREFLSSVVGSVAVVMTEPISGTEEALERASMIRYGDAISALTEPDQDLLLTRLIVQLGATKLKVFDKGRGQKWLDEHKDLVEGLFEVL